MKFHGKARRANRCRLLLLLPCVCVCVCCTRGRQTLHHLGIRLALHCARGTEHLQAAAWACRHNDNDSDSAHIDNSTASKPISQFQDLLDYFESLSGCFAGTHSFYIERDKRTLKGGRSRRSQMSVVVLCVSSLHSTGLAARGLLAAAATIAARERERERE